MRNCDLGLLPASNHATRSSRVSIGVMSTWSRAMQIFRRKRAATLHGGCKGGQLGHFSSDAKHRREPLALSAALRVGLPRPARKAKAALVPVVNEIDIGIMRTLPLGARADLEIERIALRLVDEMMTVRHTGREACCVARAQHGRAIVLDQHDFALEHVNELIFGLVPWRSAEAAPGFSRVRLTPNCMSPATSPSTVFSRPWVTAPHGSG